MKHDPVTLGTLLALADPVRMMAVRWNCQERWDGRVMVKVNEYEKWMRHILKES